MNTKFTVQFKDGCYHDVQYTQAIVKKGRLGIASCTVYPKDYGFYLSELNVYGEENYRKGYGSMLMAGIVAEVKGLLKLEVLKDNIGAIALYKKFGFCFNGEVNKNLLTMIKENK